MGIFSFLVKGSNEYRQLEQFYREEQKQAQDKYQQLEQVHQDLVRRTSHILDSEQAMKENRRLLASLRQEHDTTLQRCNELKASIAAMEKEEELIEYGVYKPAYSFDYSTEYKLKLDSVRALQKQKVKDKAAIKSPKGTGNGGPLGKLALRAFNGECDALAANVTWKNISKTLDQVGRAAQAINKLLENYTIEIDPEYITLKLNEMQLLNEFQEKKEAELEEQRAIRDQLREEEKARREYEKALQEATQEQERYHKALAEARSNLTKARGAEIERLQETIALLNKKLEDAKERGLRAQSMAELTKSGHVYVISNVGSFGDRMYKIGMTRRLEPLERIAELGDASVPFGFDVHAMIYSKDAPALESKLQSHFRSRQVNLVNDRKEFFYANLDEIEQAVRALHGEADFSRSASAKQYRESCALRDERKRQQQQITTQA